MVNKIWLAVAVEKKNNPFTSVLVAVMVVSLTICGASQWFIVGTVEVQLETEAEEELPKTSWKKKSRSKELRLSRCE